MVRVLLSILFLLLWPALAWAQDDFCGRSSVEHVCPMRSDQVCQCQDHGFCLRLASEKPGQAAPAPPRFEVLCPHLPGLILQPEQGVVTTHADAPVTQPLCHALAPEPPPPRV